MAIKTPPAMFRKTPTLALMIISSKGISGETVNKYQPVVMKNTESANRKIFIILKLSQFPFIS